MPNTFTTTGAKTHSANLSVLTNGSSYTYCVRCKDTSNNVNTSDYLVNFSVSATAIDPALVGWWKLDEGTGTQATDSSASGNNGSFVGSPSWTSGKIAGALSFNGASYVNIPNAVYSTSAGTLSLWVKNTGGGDVIGSYNSASTSRTPTFSFTNSASQKVAWEFSDKVGQTTSTTVSPNTWTHLALTYSGGNVSVYVNGVLDTQTTASLPTSFYNQLHIGHYANYGSLYFNGLVDDVRIYSRALSASEIQALYNSSAILYGDVSEDGKVSAYDAALVGQYAVSLITLTPEQITRADVSGDGKVSAYDAALIAQRAVGLISKFPVE
jgi:hypothetical protein